MIKKLLISVLSNSGYQETRDHAEVAQVAQLRRVPSHNTRCRGTQLLCGSLAKGRWSEHSNDTKITPCSNLTTVLRERNGSVIAACTKHTCFVADRIIACSRYLWPVGQHKTRLATHNAMCCKYENYAMAWHRRRFCNESDLTPHKPVLHY